MFEWATQMGAILGVILVSCVTADTGEYINDAYSLAMFWHILNMELHRQFTHIDYPI
jgi:hypothetical protein